MLLCGSTFPRRDVIGAWLKRDTLRASRGRDPREAVDADRTLAYAAAGPSTRPATSNQQPATSTTGAGPHPPRHKRPCGSRRGLSALSGPSFRACRVGVGAGGRCARAVRCGCGSGLRRCSAPTTRRTDQGRRRSSCPSAAVSSTSGTRTFPACRCRGPERALETSGAQAGSVTDPVRAPGLVPFRQPLLRARPDDVKDAEDYHRRSSDAGEAEADPQPTGRRRRSTHSRPGAGGAVKAARVSRPPCIQRSDKPVTGRKPQVRRAVRVVDTVAARVMAVAKVMAARVRAAG